MSTLDTAEYTPHEHALARLTRCAIHDMDSHEEVWESLTSAGMGVADAVRVMELLVWNATEDDVYWRFNFSLVAPALQMVPKGTEWRWEVVQCCMWFYYLTDQVDCEAGDDYSYDSDDDGYSSRDREHMADLRRAMESMGFMDGNHSHIRRFLDDPAAVSEELSGEGFAALARAYREWAVANDEWDPEGADAAIAALCG